MRACRLCGTARVQPRFHVRAPRTPTVDGRAAVRGCYRAPLYWVGFISIPAHTPRLPLHRFSPLLRAPRLPAHCLPRVGCGCARFLLSSSPINHVHAYTAVYSTAHHVLQPPAWYRLFCWFHPPPPHRIRLFTVAIYLLPLHFPRSTCHWCHFCTAPLFG